MKKLFAILIFTIVSIYGFSQFNMVTNNGQSVTTCSNTMTPGSYTVGQTYTLTVCSNDPINRHMTLFISSGYLFPAGTSLCVYDGTSTAAPLLVCFNNTTVGGTIAVQATNMNESGCLHFVFTAGASGAIWNGTFSCSFICQPRQVDIISASPAIQGDGYINVCWDEDANASMPVTFNAQGTYPSTGYTCDDASNTFYWNFQDGTPIVSGLGMTTVNHTFPARQGYTVIVTIEDSQGCENTNAVTQRVRVSRPPIWNQTTTVLTTTPPTTPPAICMGSPVNVCGYYSSSEWTSAVIPAVASPVPLPDGSGVCYTTNLMQNQFEPGQTLNSINDLLGIHMDICHTYIGDLTFFIQCPNGQEVQMGIQGGGGCNLGNPPSAGYWYVITPTATTTMQNAASGQSTLPAGNYASYQSLAGLVGCPLNGSWTIRICDNWAADAGTIFGWWIEFNPALFPEVWSYTQSYTPTIWEGLFGSQVNPPGNTNCMTGTYTTTATPDVNSLQPFTFTITDNFGCEHDTSLYVTVRHQLDPNCCVIPSVDAGADAAVCALTYSLTASSFEFPGNTGYWELVSGPGTASFSNSTSPTTNVTVSMYGTYVFEFNELHNNNPGCASNDVVSITFNDTFDPTMTDVDNICVGSAPFMLQMVDFGTLSININPSLLNTTTGQFDPSIPGTYTITNTVQDPCTGGPLSDAITFTVYDAIDVQNFEEYCGSLGTPTYFYVEFDVVGSQGGPFTGYLVNGVSQANPHFTATIESPASYTYTVEDANGCSSFPLNGYRDCVCPLYAGTMGSLQTVVLCANECTEPDVTHNGNEETYGGAGQFEFMIHTGNNQPLAYSNTPNFCFNSFAASYNTIYYVSPICGLPSGGHANITSGCYSIGAGTPVMWLENPIAHAGTNKDTCGLVIRLNGNVPAGGMYGYWSSTCDFFAVGGTSHTDPNALVMAGAYDDCTFTWNVVNGECVASDDVLIRFMATPNPYAGNDIVICGNTTEMAGVASMGGNLSWSGSGTSFNPQSSATAQTQISVFGTYQYTLTEDNGACTGNDQVLVTYIQPPSPLTTPNVDTVCGVEYDLEVLTAPTPDGYWTAYDWDEDAEIWVTASPAPLYVPNIYSDDVHVQIPNFVGNDRILRFIWTETNMVMGVECTAEAIKDVVFAKTPQASVGASNQQEICGNCVTFNASTVGLEDYQHFWIPKVIGDWTNPEGASAPNATYCVEVPSAFGDTAYIETAFYWVVKNGGCLAMDTMYVTFYQRPVANAGIDKAECGNETDMEAFWDLSPNAGYTPEGIWSVGTHPTGESADFEDHYLSNSHVTVSEVGVWEFIFREQNSLLTSCYDTDTVTIEFVETPVISAGPDKDVCGNSTTLEGITGGYGGSWLPNGAEFDDFNNPTTGVRVAAYVPTTFTWLESNSATLEGLSLSCTATDDVVITFWREPTAAILTDEADSTVCGLTFNNLRAENPGSGITGYWYNINPATVYGDAFAWSTWATVPNYGYHDFYWIEQTGPALTPGFCNDTAGPLRIRFIQIPNANAGADTLFCGYTGSLDAHPSVGTGVWTTPSVANITFANQNNPNTQVTSNVINTGNPTYPNFTLIWTEDNTNGCTDKDSMIVVFARIPTSQLDIIPPKCFGEPATIAAAEDSLPQYTWNFYTGLVESDSANINGGVFHNFIYWNSTDTAHRVSMIATNSYGCQSPINVDTVYEPIIPTFDITLIQDTCSLGKGGIIFGDTLGTSAFFWLDPNVGPGVGDPITTVYGLPVGEYGIHTSYLTPNITNYAYYLQTFGTANCIDTFYYEIEPIGMIDAEMSVSADVLLEELVAPNATVIFLNTSDYDDVSKRCEWHFDDGTIVKSCDELVEHIYTEAGCYDPFLIVMNRDLPECRDTAKLEACVFVDNASKLEVPNVFSPNGDGINDFFQVKAQTLRTFNGVITNRWGRTVFEWTDWETYESGWDGTIGGGSKASPGVYFYIITAEGMDGAPYEEYGAFHLMSE